MKLSDFDYTLPQHLIAQHPSNPRGTSRLLVSYRNSFEYRHDHFANLGEYLTPRDLLVLNNTQVLPARIQAMLGDRKIEILLLEAQAGSREWKCLVRPSKKIKETTEVVLLDGTPATVWREDSEISKIAFPFSASLDWLSRVGEIPLPPYLARAAEVTDKDRYQTVYAKNPGSVAAPTAGLHFSHSQLNNLKSLGVSIAEITLTIGYGTFAPIRIEELASHQMHREAYCISSEVFEQVERTRKQGGRVIAVGTTTLRALESIKHHGLSGWTDLFIRPGFEFNLVDALITNFHLPKSSLFILVATFMGLEPALDCYREAIQNEYRFFSYGDAMAIL